jgi:short-subunit dehydrogenase
MLTLIMKLANKTILITGAASGIGRATALKAAADKGDLVLVDVDKARLADTAEQAQALGAQVQVKHVDVSNSEEVKALFLEITEGGRVLDVVFSNAGLGFLGPIYELKIEEIDKIVDVNVKGNLYMAKYASEVFVRQQHGHLLMTSSLGGIIALPQWSAYIASKWAITGLADSIRAELKPFNVKVTTIHPGAVHSGFFDADKANVDLSRLGSAVTPDVVAEAVYAAIFSNRKRVMVPTLAKSMAFLNQYMPGVVNKLVEQMLKDVKYHDNVEEDEPEFSYVKPVDLN